MNKPDESNQAAEMMADFIISLIQLDEAFKSFSLSDEERRQFVDYLIMENDGEITGREPQSDYQELITAGTNYLKTLQKYADLKIKQQNNLLLESLERYEIPREPYPKLLQITNSPFLPKDCTALQGWPDERRPANGHSGRLENAGQFIKRLMTEGLYDEAKYGKLYLFDLRKINPKLYQSLLKWQERTGEKVLGNKKDEVEALLQRSDNETLDFRDSHRANVARWRRNG